MFARIAQKHKGRIICAPTEKHYYLNIAKTKPSDRESRFSEGGRVPFQTTCVKGAGRSRSAATSLLSYWRCVPSLFPRTRRIETELSRDVLNPARVTL